MKVSKKTCLKTGFSYQKVWSSFIGSSPGVLEIKNRVNRIAVTSLSVLISGETGSGKDLIARIIHSLSPRRDGPFVKINCAAVPENLIESELFGYVKGAYTGAYCTKPGRLEFANKGTLFLDEVVEMSPAVQPKLLQAIEEKRFVRLGASGETHIDVRIIATTNRDVETVLHEGKLREDLYYRLSESRLRMPALRDRTEDLEDILTYFIKKYSDEFEVPVFTPSAELLDALMAYDWPGNVRQLENFAKRAIVFGPEASLASLSQDGRARTRVSSTRRLRGISLKEVARAASVEAEKEMIRSALARTAWNRTKASRILGISYRSLLSKISEYGLFRSIPDGEREGDQESDN